MKKSIFTLMACICSLLAGYAQQVGDYIYTSDGRYRITGENILVNGNFAESTDNWTDDSGATLSAEAFSVEPGGGPNGTNCLLVLYKEDGPGTPTTLYRKLPVTFGKTYYISYQVKAEQAVSTTVNPDEKKNYQNIFFNQDGSLTPETAIAKSQDYASEWKQVQYCFTPNMDGYLVIHIYGSFSNTRFADFKVMEATAVVDDREVNAVIERLQAYLANPLFPNEHELLEGVIEALLAEMSNPDADPGTMNELLALVDSEAIKAFLDANSVDITGYLESGNFDDLPTTGDNQTKAGGWIIDDKMRETNPTAKTRWSVKSAQEMGAPFSGNYLQDNYPYKYVLREATVSQTLENMPAAQYMFQTKARAWVWKATDVINEDSVVRGLKTFINDEYTECYPIHHTKATAYDAYGTLAAPGTLKIGFFLTDSVAAHVDLDVEALRIIGWTQEQVDEFFMGREFTEAKQALKEKIDEARELLADQHYFYAKQLLTDSISRSQGIYDQSHELDSITNQTKRMNRAISYYKQQNAEFTPFAEDIDQAEELLADESYKNGKPELTTARDEARAFIQTLDSAVRDSAAIVDQDKKLKVAISAFMIANSSADEAYYFQSWAAENINFIPQYATDPSENAPALYPLTSQFAGHDLNNRFLFLNEGLNVDIDAAYGLTVNLPGKNQTVMGIDNLKQGDQVAFDWAFANASHGLYVTSANASYTKADGSTVTLVKSGKASENQLPNGDNQDGLNGFQRTTFTMTADGALQFYLGSSNSMLRISYVGITNADPMGVEVVKTTSVRNTADVFDLSGRKVSENGLKGLKPGIYVHQGRKLFVK